jgi:hypothetical protein
MFNIHPGTHIPLKNKLLFDFAKAARLAIRDYPQQLPATIFIDGDTQTRAASSFPFYKIKKVAFLTRTMLSDMQIWDQKPTGSLAYGWRSRDRQSKGMIYRRPSAEYDPTGMPNLAMSAAQIFDHELGHLVTKEGFKPHKLKGEVSADAFAAIRHFQRFGAADDDLAAASAYRAVAFFCGDPGHVTTPVVDRIRLDAKSFDFASLSPADTVVAAETYAANFNPAPQEWSEANRIYRPVIERYRKTGIVDRERIAETMLQLPVRSLAFRLGAGALEHYFREYSQFFEDPDWQSRRIKLKERIDALGPEGELLCGKIFPNTSGVKPQAASGEPSSVPVLKV